MKTKQLAQWGLLLIALLSSLLPLGAVQAQQPTSVYGPPTWPYKIYPGSISFGNPASWDYQGKHTGVDLWGPAGTPVYSSCTGTVIWWDDWPWTGSGSWVNTIWIDCHDGNYFGYTHLDDQEAHATVGNEITIGQQIAVTGPIERSGTGDDDHLHWMRSIVDPRTISSANLSWSFFQDPISGVDLTRSPADRLAENPVSQVLATKVYDMKANYKSMAGYKANMLMTLWGTSPGTKYQGAYSAIPADGFTGSYTFSRGSFWLNGIFGPYTIPTGWTMAEVGGVKEGGGACDVMSFVAETLAAAGFDVPRDDPTTSNVEGYVNHSTQIPGVNSLYSLAVATYSSTTNPAVKNGQDVFVTNPFESARLEWTVSGDTLTLRVIKPGAGEPQSTLPVVTPTPEIEERIKTWAEQNPEYAPYVKVITDTWEQIRRWVYGNGEEVTIKVIENPDPSTPIHLDPKAILISLGALAILLILILWLNPGAVGKTMVWVSNTAPTMVNTWKYALREGFRWWFFLIALAVIMTPALRSIAVHGFFSWVQGETTISNKMLTVLTLAFGVNLVLQKWFMAKVVKTQEGYVKEIPPKSSGCLWSFVKFVVSANLIVVLLFTVSGVNLIEAFEPPVTTPPAPVVDSTVLGQGLPPSVQYWAPDIARWSAQYGANGTEDPLVGAVIMTFESCGRPTAGSSAGAQGLFQVMPSHWPAAERVTSIMQDPEINAQKGYAWLNTCFKLYWPNDPERAFGCYNGGSGGVSGPKSFWPAETQRYVALTVPAYNELKASNGASSPTIVDWRSPGDSFCRQATTVLSQAPWNTRPIP